MAAVRLVKVLPEIVRVMAKKKKAFRSEGGWELLGPWGCQKPGKALVQTQGVCRAVDGE